MRTYKEAIDAMTWEEYVVFEEEMQTAFDEEQENFIEDIEEFPTEKVAEKYEIEYATICWYDFYGADE